MRFPDLLCRVTKIDYPILDGYLDVHTIPENKIYTVVGGENPPDLSVPLVYPTEWEFIARLYAFFGDPLYNNGFTLLKIDTKKLEWKGWHEPPHFMLEHGEFFGVVPLKAIIDEVVYDWTRTRKNPNVTKKQFRLNSRLYKTIGWRPYPIDREDDIPLIDRLLRF